MILGFFLFALFFFFFNFSFWQGISKRCSYLEMHARSLNGVLKHMSKGVTREFWLRTDNRIDRPKEKFYKVERP